MISSCFGEFFMIDRKPKVTIGICVRNGASTVKETVKSIVAQDFPHDSMEIIFVDDGSQDNTLSIIQNHALDIDIPTKVFHTSWKGLGRARNIVIDNATGEYILWVDADMMLSDDYVTKIVDFMDRNPKVGIAKGRLTLEPSENVLATLETYSRAVSKMVDFNSEKTLSKAIGTGGSIYRSAVIRQAGKFDENLRGYGEDWDLEIRVRARGWLVSIIDAKLFDYERLGVTWKNLWQKYWLRGYHSHYFLHKNPGLIKHYRMFPPAAFLTGVIHAQKLANMVHKSMVFFLPIQYVFKMTAWYFGFLVSHLNSYHPKSRATH